MKVKIFKFVLGLLGFLLSPIGMLVCLAYFVVEPDLSYDQETVYGFVTLAISLVFTIIYWKFVIYMLTGGMC